MKVKFCKYSATGNTFLVFDDREGQLPYANEILWKNLCSEHAVDGVILLLSDEVCDFRMLYRNADGGEVEMCGNGARAITHFAWHELGLRPKSGDWFKIKTLSGMYQSRALPGPEIQMTEISEFGAIDVSDLSFGNDSFYIRIAVPHAIFRVSDVEKIDVNHISPPIRNDSRFEKGANVNFFSIVEDGRAKIRTFERGVERETLSCGTGATGVAICCARQYGWKERVVLEAPGGILSVSFDESFENVFLSGAVEILERGEIELKY